MSKKETIEEVAERIVKTSVGLNYFGNEDSLENLDRKEFVIQGFKEAAKTMYSDEEVFNLCRAFATFVTRKAPSYKKQQEWFEQFKKPNNE